MLEPLLQAEFVGANVVNNAGQPERIPLTLADTVPVCESRPTFLSACFRGYRRYLRLGPQGPGMLWCHSTGAWREEEARFLLQNAASCFFTSLIWVIEREALQAVKEYTAGLTDRFQHVFTPAEAFLFLVRTGVRNVDIASMNADGSLHRWVEGQPRPEVSRTLVYVPINDKHEFAPHWLPATCVVLNRRFPWSFEDLEALCPGGAPLPLITPGQREALREQWLAARPPDAPEPLPAARVEPDFDDLPDVYGYCCVNTPPFTHHFGLRRQAEALVAPRLWCRSGTVDATGLTRMETDKPDWADLALAHTATGRVGIMWELHPSTLRDAELHPDDWVFVEAGRAPHPRDPDLHDNGQYNVQRVSSIQTKYGQYLFGDLKMTVVKGIPYLLWRLVRGESRNLLWALVSRVPYVTETVTSVTTIPRREQQTTPDQYPTMQAFLRVAYDAVVQHASPEAVARLNACRNEELSRGQYSGLHPREVARAVEQELRSVAAEWSVPGEAPSLPFMFSLP